MQCLATNSCSLWMCSKHLHISQEPEGEFEPEWGCCSSRSGTSFPTLLWLVRKFTSCSVFPSGESLFSPQLLTGDQMHLHVNVKVHLVYKTVLEYIQSH